MGAPAISTRTRPARPAAKPRRAPAKPRPAAAKPRASAAKPRASTATARPKARTAAARPRARAAAPPTPGIRGLTPAAAVGRTAVAVVSLPDCGLMMSITRSRRWIGVLGVLLGGIVALNVWGLSLTASGSATAAKIDELQRQNSVLRGRTATRLTNGRVEAAAADLGLSVPAAGDVTYLKVGAGDAERAAARISSGAIALVEAVAPEPIEPLIDPAAATPDPLASADTAVAPVDPTTVADPTVADPAAADPATTEPAATDPTVTDTAAAAAVQPAAEPTTDAAGAYAP